VVVLNGVIGFVQEYRARKAIRSLAEMTAPEPRVVRDGCQRAILGEDVVPGTVPVAVDTRTNATGHWTIFQVHSNAAPRPTVRPRYVASDGPARMSDSDARTKTARKIVSTITTSRAFHHDRPSSTS